MAAKRKRSKRQTKAGFLFGILAFVFIYFLLGILLDCTYYNKIQCGCLQTVLKFLKSCASTCHVRYLEMYKAIAKNFGFFLTILSIIISMVLNIFNRMEQRSFGLPQEQFFRRSVLLTWKATRSVIPLTPLILLIELKFQAGISVVFTMLYVYAFVLVSFYLLASSYGKETAKKKVIKRLIESVSVQDKREGQYFKLLSIVENIRLYAEKDTYWESTEEMFENLVDTLAKKEDVDKCIIISYCFFNVVFGMGCPLKGEIAVRVFHKYVRQLDIDSLSAPQEEIDKRNVMLWCMVCSAFASLPKEQIQAMIRIIRDYKGRCSFTIAKCGKIVPRRQMDIQMGF